MSEEGCQHLSLCCASKPAWLCVESAQTGHSTYHVFAQGPATAGAARELSDALVALQRSQDSKGRVTDCILALGSLLDKLLYNHCLVQPAEQNCNIFPLSSCSFGSSYLISFIHVNVFKNAAASACRMVPIVPFVHVSGLFLSLLSPFLQRDTLCMVKKYLYSLILDMNSAMGKAEGIFS